MTQLADDTALHLSNVARSERGAALGNGRAPAWLDELIRSGIDRFAAVGFPKPKDEEWRFTNFAPVMNTKFEPAVPAQLSPDDIARFGMRREAAAELVFVNGFFAPSLSKTPATLPRGVRAQTLADALAAEGDHLRRHLGRHAGIEKNPFVALNTGFLRDGAYVFIPRGTTLRQPIHLMFVSTARGAGSPAAAHPRVLVVAEEGAEATVVESYVGADEGVYFTNAVTEIVAGAGSRVDHYKVQEESRRAYHVAAMQVTLERSAVFISHSATLGGKLTRNNLECVMGGERADATLNGLVILGGDQHADNHTTLDHASPHCPSHELYKHVLDGKSSAVFKGKILVRQPAQKTDSKQNSKSLLLSSDATMNSQPALEIYADDVKCTHGSTTGPVDEDMVFYLRTRGVSLEAARHLLTYAFAADVTRRIKVDAVRERLESFIASQHNLPLDLRITDLGSHDDAAR